MNAQAFQKAAELPGKSRFTTAFARAGRLKIRESGLKIYKTAVYFR